MVRAVEVRLKRRPLPGESVSVDTFSIDLHAPERMPSVGQVACRTLHLSVDPFLRCRFQESTGVDYTFPYSLGGLIESAGIGVVESVGAEVTDVQPGDLLLQAFDSWPWGSRVVLDRKGLARIPIATALIAPLSSMLGVLGTTGLTAHVAIMHHAKNLGSDSVFVISGAAGAVGHIAGQLAKKKGAFVIGVCSGSEKGQHLTLTCGFDAAIDRRLPSFAEDLKTVLQGRQISHYFDNAGGSVTDTVIEFMAPSSEIILCGQIATYNDNVEYPPPLPELSAQLVAQRGISRDRFLVLNYQKHFAADLADLAFLVASGELKVFETITHGGAESAPGAFVSMMNGANLGKALVTISNANAPRNLQLANWARESLLSGNFRGRLARRYMTPDAFTF